MEIYVYYSITIFMTLIFFLFIYLLFDKITNSYRLKKVEKYEKNLVPYLNDLFIKLEEQYPEPEVIQELNNKMKNKIVRKIIMNKIIYFISTFKGNIRKNLIKLSEETCLIKYILKDFKKGDLMKISFLCKNLGELRSREALPHLIKVLDNKSSDIKYNALMAISKIGDVDSIVAGFSKLNNNTILSERSLIEIVDSFEGDKTELYEKMIANENSHLAAIFIKSAGNYLDVRFNDNISKFVKCNNLDKRLAAIKVIGQTVDIRFIDDIIECLKDSNWQVRAVAAKSLGRIEDSRALPGLVEALSDREWWVRYNSAQAIFKISDGIEVVERIFLGKDSFAKDILLDAMETSGVFANLNTYSHSIDFHKRNLEELVMKYINKSELGDKKDELELV